jgi:hypothetical protein
MTPGKTLRRRNDTWLFKLLTDDSVGVVDGYGTFIVYIKLI